MAFVGLDAAIVHTLLPAAGGADPLFAARIIVAGCWIAYFVVSKRVSATFTR